MGSVRALKVRTTVPYRIFPSKEGTQLYCVFLDVQIANPAPNGPRTRRFEALIDSGATRCVFHAGLAGAIGLDYASGELETTTGIGGREQTWLHDVNLYVPGGPVKIRAAFKPDLPVLGLLGTNGFFEHFDVTFQGGAKQCVLNRIHSD